MTYYLLTVWKKSGEKSNNANWLISDNFKDLLHDMMLFTIQEDEMYVIDQFTNGKGEYKSAVVVASWYYDHDMMLIADED